MAGDKIVQEDDRARAQILRRITACAESGSQVLDLYGLSIPDMPWSALARLKNLRELSMRFCDVEKAGAQAIAQHLKGLTSLDLSHNNIGEAGAQAIAQHLKGLTSLSLGANSIGDAGAQAIARHLTDLTSLGLSGNSIGEAGAQAIAQHLTGLTSLDLSNNSIGDAGAQAIAQRLTGLTSLDLWGNIIGDAGALAITEKLTSLTSLDLSLNRIGDAGAQAIAEHLTGLTSLDLSGNSIGEAGAQAIAQHLTGLTSLDLGGNSIGDAGAQAIAQRLTGLTSLNLSENEINDHGLRAALEALAAPGRQNRIWRLGLIGNPATFLAKEILESFDGQAILAAWKSYKEAEQRGELVPLNEAKILIVGEEAVGKSSLVQFLVKNQPRIALDPTQGIEKTPWQPPGTAIKTIIWDFAGQEITHGTHQYFLTERSLYILVLNDRKQDDRSVYRWLPVIAARGEDSPVIVVINQSDKGKEHLVLQWEEIRKSYPSVVKLLRTSCDDDEWARKSIADLRELIANTLNQSPALQAIRDKVPTSWIRIKERIAAKASEKMILVDGDFKTDCERPQIDGELPGLPVTDEAGQRNLLRTLHNLGVVIAHGLGKDDTTLPPRLQILDPNWLTQAIYGVLQSQELRSNQGCFRKSDLARWLDATRYPVKFHGEILSLMLDPDIELAVELGKKNHYLVPQILPAKEVDWDSYLKGQWLSFAYHYAPLPSGLIARFIVRTFEYSKDAAARTRYGVMINVHDCNVHVGIKEESHVLTVRVAGPENRRVEALAYARGVIEELNAANNITPDRRVPLPDAPNLSVAYDHLLKLRDSKGPNYAFPPEGAQRDYTVQELLEGIRDVEHHNLRRRPNVVRRKPQTVTPQTTPSPTTPPDTWFRTSVIVGSIAAGLALLSNFFGALDGAPITYKVVLAILLGVAVFLATVLFNPATVYRRLIAAIVIALITVPLLNWFSVLEAMLKMLDPRIQFEPHGDLGWNYWAPLLGALFVVAYLEVNRTKS